MINNTEHTPSAQGNFCGRTRREFLWESGGAFMSLALTQMFQCSRPGGGCLVTLRDYDNADEGRSVVHHGLRTFRGERYVVFQTRAFDGDRYDVSMYFVAETDPPQVSVGRSRYYSVSPSRVMELMGEVGFLAVQRFDDAFYQPVLVGTRPQ